IFFDRAAVEGRHVEVAPAVEGQSIRPAGNRCKHGTRTVRRVPDHRVVPVIGHVKVARTVERDLFGSIEIAYKRRADAVGAEFLNGSLEKAGHIDAVGTAHSHSDRQHKDGQDRSHRPKPKTIFGSGVWDIGPMAGWLSYDNERVSFRGSFRERKPCVLAGGSVADHFQNNENDERSTETSAQQVIQKCPTCGGKYRCDD